MPCWLRRRRCRRNRLKNLRFRPSRTPPFSMIVDGVDAGFSVDLLNAVADQLGRTVTYDRKDSFADILGAV